MAQVTIKKAGETPTDRVVNAANERTVVTDSKGRTIEVRKLTPLDRMRMSRAAGSENATNQPYMVYALVAFSTANIGGHEKMIPQSQGHLEAVISELGEEGYEAVLSAVIEMHGEQSEGDLVEEAKN